MYVITKDGQVIYSGLHDPLAPVAEGYNPDNFTPPNQFPVWIAHGRPVKDVLGRELDVRGQLTGDTQFSPYAAEGGASASPSAPAPGPVAGSRFFEPEGDPTAPGYGGFWRLGFAPGDTSPFYVTFSLSDGSKPAKIYGDGGFAQGDVTVAVDGGPDMSLADADGMTPLEPGGHSLIIKLVKNTHTDAVGTGATAIRLVAA